jgi:hypothetical protein
MRFLVRQHDRQPDTGGNGSPDSPLDTIRAQGSDLLSEADAAIQRALGNGNSEAFLRAGRQQGGQ